MHPGAQAAAAFSNSFQTASASSPKTMFAVLALVIAVAGFAYWYTVKAAKDTVKTGLDDVSGVVSGAVGTAGSVVNNAVGTAGAVAGELISAPVNALKTLIPW